MMTDDERQVMRAVLDQTLRPRRDGMIQLGRGTTEAPTSRPDPRFLVFDSTIASCEHDPIVDRPTARGCISTSSFDYLDRVPQMSGLLSRTVFLERNAKSLPIAGTIGEDVVYIPSSIVTTPRELSDFRRGHPSESAVIAFSVPAFIGGSAVIFYHHFDASGGFVHLVRRDSAWSIVTTSGWIE